MEVLTSLRDYQKEHPISAGAMLNAVILRGHEGIYGVKNVLAALRKEELTPYFREMEMELIGSGLAAMDFDGGFSLEPEFAALVDACASCGKVLMAASRRDKRERMLTCYLCEKGIYALEEVEDGEYLLHTDMDPV